MASTSSAPPPPLMGPGTTIGGANSNKKTDVMPLEYVTFRVPYEEMNMKFRNGQKEMDKAAANVAKATAMITELTQNATSSIPKEQLAKKFDFLMKQVRDAKKTLETVCAAQIADAEKIKRRCELIDEELAVDPKTDQRGAERLERQRYGRYIVWHLLRCGYVQTARCMVDEMNLHEMVDIEIFENIHSVEKSLINDRSTGPALEWIEKHRSKLRRLNSRIEIIIRQLDVVDMIEHELVGEAILYVKQHITPIAKLLHSEDLKRTMTAIACPYEQSVTLFPDMHAVDRFEKAAELFIKEVYEVYEIHGSTALSILIQCGIAAFKTPSCHCDESVPPEKVRCFVCRPDIWPIAEKLPFAHVENSRILCSMTNELCNDEDNKPFMFPSGHVFGAKTIERHLRRPDGKIWDPVHKRLMEEAEALRLYFL